MQRRAGAATVRTGPGSHRGGLPNGGLRARVAEMVEHVHACRSFPEAITGDRASDPLLAAARSALRQVPRREHDRLLALAVWTLVCHLEPAALDNVQIVLRADVGQVDALALEGVVQS